MEEIFDVCTITRQPLGKTCIRGNKLGENEYHIVVMAVLSNEKGEILLTKRSKNKIAAGKWECTAGCVIAGEKSKDAIIREIKEEIGIMVNIENIEPVRSYIEDDALFDIWPIKTNCEVDKLVLQKSEVDEAKYATISPIKEIINSGEATKSLYEIVRLCENGIIRISK
jgi:NADH pyrophosphatase NudC (nudix superfamily)